MDGRSQSPKDVKSALGLLENGRIELISLKQFVEFGAVPFRQARCLSHVTPSDLKHAYQIVSFKIFASVFERYELFLFPVHGVVDKYSRNEGSSTQGDASLDNIHKLPHITRP